MIEQHMSKTYIVISFNRIFNAHFKGFYEVDMGKVLSKDESISVGNTSTKK